MCCLLVGFPSAVSSHIAVALQHAAVSAPLVALFQYGWMPVRSTGTYDAVNLAYDHSCQSGPAPPTVVASRTSILFVLFLLRPCLRVSLTRRNSILLALSMDRDDPIQCAVVARPAEARLKYASAIKVSLPEPS